MLPTVGAQKDKAIRSHAHRTTWYPSKGVTLLDEDTLVQLKLNPQPNSGDLFIHLCGGDIQVFLCERHHSTLKWLPVRTGYKHPYINTHCLFIAPDGTPSWVKPNTIATYKGPARRRTHGA